MIGLYLFLIHIICYWTMVYIYDKNVNVKDYKISVTNSIKNQILYTFPSTIIFFNYYPIQYNNLLLSFTYIPILIIVSDCYFYITHRPLHTKWLYYLHKSHHTGEVHVAKSLDAHGLEHIIGNLGSFICGIALLWYYGFIINIYIISIWIGLATINTCISHSNYKCSLDSGNHYLHHKYRNCNYGFGLYLLDRILGTYI